MIIKAILIALSAILYRLGGADGYSKLFRRIGVPICIGVNTVINQDWWALLALPLLYGALSMGYGINSRLTKLLKNPYYVRGAAGLLYALANLPILWGNWALTAFYIIMLVTWVTLNGNQKFRKGMSFNDVTEEFSMGIMIATIPILV